MAAINDIFIPGHSYSSHQTITSHHKNSRPRSRIPPAVGISHLILTLNVLNKASADPLSPFEEAPIKFLFFNVFDTTGLI